MEIQTQLFVLSGVLGGLILLLVVLILVMALKLSRWTENKCKELRSFEGRRIKICLFSLQQTIDGGYDRYVPDSNGKDNAGYQGDGNQHQSAGKLKIH